MGYVTVTIPSGNPIRSMWPVSVRIGGMAT